VDSYGDPQEGGLGVDVTVEGDPVRPALHVEGRDGGMMGYLNKVNKRENNRGKFTVQRIINSVFMHIFWTKPIQSRTLWPSNIIEIKT
jgi:hypothetical protein